MIAQTIILPRNRDNATRAVNFIQALPLDKPFRIEVSDYKPRRSDEQNRFLWLTYGKILETGGEDMAGWTKDDLHEFFLISHFGSEVRELFGRKRHVPLRRSSKLNKMEFVDFVSFIQRFMAERGVYLPDPNEEIAA